MSGLGLLAQVNLIADVTKSGNAGTLEVETKGLGYIESIAGTGYVVGDLTTLPLSPEVPEGYVSSVNAGQSGTGTSTVVQTGTGAFSFGWNLPVEPEV